MAMEVGSLGIETPFLGYTTVLGGKVGFREAY